MSCVAFGCYNNSSKKIAGITFHRFPKEEILRKEWAKAVKRDNWNPSKHSFFVQRDFAEGEVVPGVKHDNPNPFLGE
ncbi:hypothetical protein JTE90_009629 [Oedothorax gibbosus]|uniref:THAP-type domain-containing protein n=1 Tax=Oedothorax gibbosus TaxID=931172 RepID=A0AAV6VBG7_9ARAC|nr:hypothetical protein JTE90_009629 [Oedothorax gibbosus]